MSCQVDDGVISAVSEDTLYLKRSLTKYLCKDDFTVVMYRDYDMCKNILSKQNLTGALTSLRIHILHSYRHRTA